MEDNLKLHFFFSMKNNLWLSLLLQTYLHKDVSRQRKDMSTSVMPSPPQVYFDELYKSQTSEVFHYWF